MSARIKIRCVQKQWMVTCEACDGDFFSMFSPWMIAGNHSTALTLARWHIEQHAARTCDHCHRTDTIERPRRVDAAHVELDGKLYEIRSSGVVAIGTASPRTRP